DTLSRRLFSIYKTAETVSVVEKPLINCVFFMWDIVNLIYRLKEMQETRAMLTKKKPKVLLPNVNPA
ncbi:11036_t:CDS:2, partial [Dentiscutata heterogama]